MVQCPLCGHEFDESGTNCESICPLAKISNCNLICCPNCGYEMVDERKSGMARLLRKVIKPGGPEGKTPGRRRA